MHKISNFFGNIARKSQNICTFAPDFEYIYIIL